MFFLPLYILGDLLFFIAKILFIFRNCVLLTTIFEQGNQVMVANLGDSRAVMIGTSEDGETKVVQLTNDLKPSVPSKFLKLIG